MRAAIALGVVTVLVAVAAALWTPVAVPRIVRLPPSFDTDVSASGTFVVSAAPGSLARLPAPTSLPVNVELNVAAVSADDQSIVISSTQTQKVGAPSGPTQDVVLKSQYVLDRRTAQNIADPRAWSFTPDHPVNRAGSYSFAFGFDFDPAATYPLWDDSIGASYPLKQGGGAAGADTGGLTATPLTGTTTQPADPAWIAALTPLQLPKELSVEQWKAAGFEVASPSASIATNYLVTLSTDVSIDNTTGGTANLTQAVVTLAVRPDPAATGGTPAQPQTVFVTTVSEAPASVTTDVAEIRTDGDQVRLATTTIPRVLAAVAVVFALLTVGVFVLGRRRRQPTAAA